MAIAHVTAGPSGADHELDRMIALKLEVLTRLERQIGELRKDLTGLYARRWERPDRVYADACRRRVRRRT